MGTIGPAQDPSSLHLTSLRPVPASSDFLTFRDRSFAAGQDAGARTSACVARLAAAELMDGARWWNRWRRRLMARALVACAEEMESAADEGGMQEEAGRSAERSARPV